MKEIQYIFNPKNILLGATERINDLLKTNFKTLSDKLINPNQKFELISFLEIKSILSNVILSIKTNNKEYSELNSRRDKLTLDIWYYMANNCIDEISTYDRWYDKSQGVIISVNGAISSLIVKRNGVLSEITDLQGGTANTKKAVDNINLCLKHAGFTGFKINEREKIDNIAYYYLHRDGVDYANKDVFGTLSEGEKNFISFLYFYQLCLGTDDYEKNKSKKKIIVIDDPVSSLDSQVLFIISTLIRQLIAKKGNDNRDFKIKHIEQIFILTHNLYFYKEVVLKRLICKDYMHYKISKNNNISSISSSKDKFISDDYSLLWGKIKGSNSIDKSNNIIIANVMRRLIETYVTFIGLGKASWDALSENSDDDPKYIIKCVFVSMINDDSHGVSPFDNAYYQKITTEEPKILFDIFEDIFRIIGEEHYNMMMGN